MHRGVFGLESTGEASVAVCCGPLEETLVNLGAPLKLIKFRQ